MDVMLPITLWAYQTTCKVSTQHTPYKVVYGLMPLLPTEFIVPTNQTFAKKDGSWMNALLVRMEDLVLLDEKQITVWKNIDYVQIFRKLQRNDEKHLKIFEDGDLVLWLWKDLKIKEGKFLFPWTDLFSIKKAFTNNTIQLNTSSNEDVTLVNVNKLKAYLNPIITIVVITIITQDENRILPNQIPRRIIGRRRHFYKRFKFNEHRGEAQHNKNYDNKIIIALPKKWIRDHK